LGERDDSERESWRSHPVVTFLLWAGILAILVVIVVSLWWRNFHPAILGF
jgi:hypothetical protein